MIQIKNYTAGENQMIGFIKYINYKDGYGYISIPDRATLTQLIYMIVITIDLRISRLRKFYNNIACKSSVSSMTPIIFLW